VTETMHQRVKIGNRCPPFTLMLAQEINQGRNNK
jgi:hypothetical protein